MSRIVAKPEEVARSFRPEDKSAQILRDPPFPWIDDERLNRLDVAGPRYTSYPTAPQWTERFGPADHAQVLAVAAASASEPLSLYVHLPFCHKMCSYCGCNVIVTRDRHKVDRYLAAVGAELRLVAAALGRRRTVSRVHLGGGTPTFLDEAQLTTLWRSITDELTIADDAELAVEIEPTVTTLEQLTLLRGFGFNRLSMGVQDFDPDVLRVVNRVQTVADTRRMIEHARAVGYRSVNVDLIYGLPMQAPPGWQRTLEQILALRPDRVAVFSFAHVPVAKPHQRRLPVAHMPRGRAKLALFEQAYEAFRTGGYRAIGLDHFALPTDELAHALDERRLWRDFQGYTVRRAADTVAVGISGISSVAGAYAQNLKSLRAHEEAVAAGRLPIERGWLLGDDDRRRREVITQLMCNSWVDLGSDSARVFAAELHALAHLADEGLVTVRGNEVELTTLGRVFARNVAMVFDAYLGSGAEGARAYSRTV